MRTPVRRTLKIKEGVKVQRHELGKTTSNRKLIAQAVWECLNGGDIEGAVEMIKIHRNASSGIK
jgi:hypothetical protein